METLTATRNWPTNEIDAERQAAAYLPLQGTKSTLLPHPWPQDPGFPGPSTVLRSLTQWFRQRDPQPLCQVPRLTSQWLRSIPESHRVMRQGVPWLTTHEPECWPIVAVTALLAHWEAIQHGQETQLVVPAVQEAVQLWQLDQAIRQHLHEAVGRVSKTLQERGASLPPASDAVIYQAVRDQFLPPASHGKSEALPANSSAEPHPVGE